MKKIFFSLSALLALSAVSNAQTVTSGYPLSFWSTGLDGSSSIYQKAVMYAENSGNTQGLLIEGPLDASSNRLPLTLGWRGGNTAGLKIAGNGNAGFFTNNPQSALQLGEFNVTSTNRFVIPGTYNFEQISMGQDGNGHSSMEFVNHVSSTESFGVKIGTNSDYFGRGLYITAADVNSGYSGLAYNTTAPAVFVSLNNNVGIGTKAPNPAYKMDVDGTVGVKQTLFLKSNGTNSTEILMYKENGGYNSIYSSVGGFGFYNSTTDRVNVFIGNNDNVGIGTQTPAYKLSVAGTVGAKKVKVTLDGWADFVFHPDYKLPALGELERFVKEHGHLPGIPTEAEVKENGVDLGEMNVKLLQKVEELTLYMIELKKEMEAMKAEHATQKTSGK